MLDYKDVTAGLSHVFYAYQVRRAEQFRDILADQGQSKDKSALNPAQSLVFIQASTGNGVTKISCGKNVVIVWVDKLDSSPLYEMFRGVIDRDAGNSAVPRVQIVGRYSTRTTSLIRPWSSA